MRRLLVAAVACLLAAGCGHPLIPAQYAHPTPGSSGRTAGPSPSGVTGAPDAAVPHGKPLLGVDLYALNNYSSLKVKIYGQRTLAYIKNVLKADAVGIVWNFYAPTATSSRVERTAQTLSPRNVAILTRIAHRDGLTVVYRPLIFFPNHGWEGKIDPADSAAWFNSYYHAELPYLRRAQRFHIAAFVAETEMHQMNPNPGWPAFFKRLSNVYHGTITYAAWDGDYFPPAGHLLPTASLGVDMYEAMPSLSPAASLREVLRGWAKYFDQMPQSVVQRTTIDEIGIEARAGAYRDPANLGARGRLNEKVQATWFTAACRAVRKYRMRGVFFWKVDLTDNPVYPASSLSTFEGKRGARAIAHCSSILG